MDPKNILRDLQKYRYLSKYVSDDPEMVMKDCIASFPSKNVIYPCDVVELRSIFQAGGISASSPIVLFPQKFSEKYLKHYSIFLEFDASRLSGKTERYGGILFYYADAISIGDNLIRIVMNEPAANNSFPVLQQLVKEFQIGAECLISNSVPALTSNNKSTIKFAASDIKLTPKEDLIFSILKKVKNEYKLPVEYRVAGGWVRDKLMGVENDDIDIAINLPGYEVAQYVEKYGKEKGEDIGSAYNVSLDKTISPVEKGNQSSDLMVGSIPIHGMKVEFVPMRTESYPDPHSRKPMIIRTDNPKEDALRRDLTINSIFYNIETGKIEDYVGGIMDLGLDGRAIKLKTPDNPDKTFKEDPLRVLRVLRFHSKYPGSIIDSKILESISDPEIHKAYQKKVATERAGPEIMKMLMGSNPVDSIKILFESGLYKTVFRVPSMGNIHPDGINMDQKSPYHKFNLAEHTLKVLENINRIMQEKGESPKMRGIMNLASLFHDFGKMRTGTPHPDQPERMMYPKHEDESVIMAEEIMNSLGLEQKDKDMAKMVIQMHMQAVDQPEKWSPKRIGRFMRSILTHGKEEEYKDLWKYILYHAEADSMSSNPEVYKPEERQNIFNQFNNYISSPVGKQLSVLPLNGNEIMALPMFSGLNPSSGYINVVKNKLQEWQDESPEVLTKERAIQLLSEHSAEIQQEISGYSGKKNKTSQNWFSKLKR